MKLALRIVRFLLTAEVGSFARAIVRVGIALGVAFGLNVSEEQLAGIMVAVEAALQAFARVPWDRWDDTEIDGGITFDEDPPKE